VNSENAPPLPSCYASWLDYAVDTFDTRGLWVESLFEDGAPLDRDAVRKAAQDELRELRALAARARDGIPKSL